MLDRWMALGLAAALAACGAETEEKKSDKAGGTPETAALARLEGADATDPDKLAELAKAIDLEEVTGFEETARHRGTSDAAAVWVLYPRGTLLTGDIGEFRIDVGEEFETPGKLEFRRGTKVLYSAAFDPEELITRATIPDAVRESVTAKAGVVTWGFYPDKGKAITAKFTVKKRDSSLDRRLASLEKRLVGQPPVVQTQLRAQLLLNKKYYYAAWKAAAAAAEEAESAPQAVAIMQAALGRMKLNKTPLWAEAQALADAVPQRLRDRTQSRKLR